MPKKNSPSILIVMTVAELILKHGPEVAVKIMAAWTPENPTVDEWNSLRVKDPEEYLPA